MFVQVLQKEMENSKSSHLKCSILNFLPLTEMGNMVSLEDPSPHQFQPHWAIVTVKIHLGLISFGRNHPSCWRENEFRTEVFYICNFVILPEIEVT